ncbi:MAG: hypothetical protein JWQ11_2706, partial [Rhizobacter sp.]|nr:hypothetical protein [Rhizobacter sp.]
MARFDIEQWIDRFKATLARRFPE